MTHDPTADQRLLQAQPHFDVLRLSTDQLRAISWKFQPIYHYYFPPTWGRVLLRALRLAPQSDFSKYLPALKNFHDEAWQVVERARRALEAIRICGIEPALAQAAELGFNQVYLDGSTIIAFWEYIRAMDERNPEALTYLAGVKQLSDQARANLVRLHEHGAALARSVQ